MSILAPGTKVNWTLRTNGKLKEKSGIVVAFVPAARNARIIAQRHGLILKKSQSEVADFHRYIVLVPRGGKSTLKDVCLPRFATDFVVCK